MKNEVRLSRSLDFRAIFHHYLEKYDHVVYACCVRNKVMDRVDLLKPGAYFYNLVNIIGLFIIWALIILAAGIINNPSFGTYFGVGIALTLVASILIIAV